MKMKNGFIIAFLSIYIPLLAYLYFIYFRPIGQTSGVDPCGGWHLDENEGNPVRSEDTVLVTGGSGFIGSHLVATLLDLGYRVRVLDSLTTGNAQYINPQHQNLTFTYGDIHDVPLLRKVMNGVTGLFHLAAASKVLPSLTNSSMATFNVEENAIGTAKVLEVAQQSKTVKKIVYAASSTYYGNQKVPFGENDPFSPSSPYAASKYMGELQFITFDELYDIPSVLLRYFMVYGPRNPSVGPYGVVTGKFVANYLKNETLRIEGTGLHSRDFIHVEDAVRANILALQSSLRGVVINVGSGTSVSVKELANLVDPVNQKHVAERPKDLRETLCDTCRAKELLRFEARKEFVPSLKDLIARGKKKETFVDAFWIKKEEKLIKEFPRWRSLTMEEKNLQIRNRLEQDPRFLLSL